MRVVVWSLLLLMYSSMATAGTISGRIAVLGEPEHKDAVVYIEGDFKGPFQAPMKNPEILQHDQAFRPAALAVLRGSTVEFPNNDDVFHNAFSFSPSNPFDFGPYGPGREQRVRMKRQGMIEIFCDVHDHMYAYIIVLKHPYFAMTEQGSYTITNVPEGNYTIKAFLNPEVVVTKTVEVKKVGSRVNINFTLDADS